MQIQLEGRQRDTGEPSLCLIVSAEKDVWEAVSPAPDFSSDKT